MAGQSMRDLKRRIRAVKNTQQITKAMEMVAASKFRRAQQQLMAGLPFNEKLETILARLLQHGRVRERFRELSPLLQVREVKRVAYVVVAADRGLAGGYNVNVLRYALQTLQSDERERLVIAVGRRARDFFVRRGIELYREGIGGDYIYLGDELEYNESRRLTRLIRELYEKGTVDEVNIIYNLYLSASSYRPHMVRLLPVDVYELAANGEVAADHKAEAEDGPGQAPIFEPSPERLLDALIPRFLDTRVYSILLGAKTAEQSARMLAMRNATENAEEMIEALTLSFNRARQDSITTEISEIVGGANALAGGEW